MGNLTNVNMGAASPFSTISVPVVTEVGAGPLPVAEAPIIGRRRVRAIKGARPCDRYVSAPVSGDSLRDDGILDGDQAILKLTFELSEVTQGRLVVVRCPGGNLMKHFHLTDDGMVRLASANPEYPDLYFELQDVEVQAIVVRTERVREWN
jgi:SOS-response transcriptional repressor LexA